MKFFYFLFFISFISQAKDLRIIAVNEPPASYLNDGGMPEGYVVDIVNAIQEQLNTHIKIEFVPEARALKIADNTDNIIFFSFSRTAFREDNYHWLGLVMRKDWNIFALKNSPLIVEKLSDLTRLPLIGVVRGDVREEWLINHQFINLDSVTHHEQNIKRLLIGRLPAIAYEEQGLAYLCKLLNIDVNQFKSVYVINQSAVYIAMSKQGTSEALVNQWKKAFKLIKINGTLYDIASKWQTKIHQDLGLQVNIVDDILVF